MAYADKTIRFVVGASAAVAANTTLAVGTNFAQDARPPSGYSAGEWGVALFRPYSGGAFVPGWGTHGAFAMFGHGGHSDDGTVDGVLFDFADYTWKCLLNTNGAPHNHRAAWTPGETDGPPYYAISGTGGSVPPPYHTYRIPLGVGSDLVVPMLSYPLNPVTAAIGAWRCRLNYATQDCTWSRLTTDDVQSYYGLGGGDEEWTQAHYDPLRGRVWFPSRRFSETNTMPSFRPGTDSTWTTSSYSTITTAAQQNGSTRGNLILDTTRDCFWCLGANGTLYRMNLANPPAALTWTAQSSSGLATVITADGRQATRWHEYPVTDGGDGCFYTHTTPGVSRLAKFDPTTGAFSFETIDNGPTLPSWATAYPGHYSRFFYVPARKCFAWIPDFNLQVYLLRP